jgi:hypothetical protein
VPLPHPSGDFEPDEERNAYSKNQSGEFIAMSWLPGWNTIAGSHGWENAFFWGSIIALILLGVMEVASHRAAQRKDELTERQQTETQHRHDEEIARLHLETAAANERAENARLEQERLKQIVKWRTIDPADLTALVGEISKGSGQIDLAYIPGDPESQYFALKIIGDAFIAVNKSSDVLKWHVYLRRWFSDAMFFGVAIPGPENEQVLTLRRAFSAAHIEFFTENLPNETPPVTLGNGLNWTPPPKHDALILVGLRNPTR